jgi:hypothetical protein
MPRVVILAQYPSGTDVPMAKLEKLHVELGTKSMAQIGGTRSGGWFGSSYPGTAGSGSFAEVTLRFPATVAGAPLAKALREYWKAAPLASGVKISVKALR